MRLFVQGKAISRFAVNGYRLGWLDDLGQELEVLGTRRSLTPRAC